MAYTNKGSKWETQNSKIFILSFFPFLQSIPFFHMNSKIPNKKWKIEGILSIVMAFIFVVLSVAFAVTAWNDPYDTTQGRPDQNDYITQSEFMEKYADEIENEGWTIESTPEYQEYDKAFDEWLNSDECNELEEKESQWNSRFMALMMASIALGAAFNIAMIISAFNQRVVFLRKLARIEDGKEVAQDFQSMRRVTANVANRAQVLNQSVQPARSVAPPVQPTPQPVYQQPVVQAAPVQSVAPTQPVAPPVPVQPVAPVQPAPVQQAPQKAFTPPPVSNPGEVKLDDLPDYMLNVNSATEAEIEALPGITIIDAKKAITYRENNGVFSTIDEFYDSMGLMPHVIANIMDSVYVGNKTVPTPTTPVAPAQPVQQAQPVAPATPVVPTLNEPVQPPLPPTPPTTPKRRIDL